MFFLRSSADMDNATLTVTKGETKLYSKQYAHLRPPEMERLTITLLPEKLGGTEPLRFRLEVNEHE
ncbi:MAG: hypothetical protein R2881_03410 [Eubacteriales bacterium]